MALQQDSPARDTGANPLKLKADQRNRTRIKDGDGDGVARPDIGAFEV
jgi:hypothetical protein